MKLLSVLYVSICVVWVCLKCVCSHRAVAQVSHVAGVAEQLSKHVRCGFFSALQHPHRLVTAASDTHIPTKLHTHVNVHAWQNETKAFVNGSKYLLLSPYVICGHQKHYLHSFDLLSLSVSWQLFHFLWYFRLKICWKSLNSTACCSIEAFVSKCIQCVWPCILLKQPHIYTDSESVSQVFSHLL